MDCEFIETQKAGRALHSGGCQLERELKDGTFYGKAGNGIEWKLEIGNENKTITSIPIAQNEWLYESCALPLLLYCAL